MSACMETSITMMTRAVVIAFTSVTLRTRGDPAEKNPVASRDAGCERFLVQHDTGHRMSAIGLAHYGLEFGANGVCREDVFEMILVGTSVEEARSRGDRREP